MLSLLSLSSSGSEVSYLPLQLVAGRTLHLREDEEWQIGHFTAEKPTTSMPAITDCGHPPPPHLTHKSVGIEWAFT